MTVLRTVRGDLLAYKTNESLFQVDVDEKGDFFKVSIRDNDRAVNAMQNPDIQPFTRARHVCSDIISGRNAAWHTDTEERVRESVFYKTLAALPELDVEEFMERVRKPLVSKQGIEMVPVPLQVTHRENAAQRQEVAQTLRDLRVGGRD